MIGGFPMIHERSMSRRIARTALLFAFITCPISTTVQERIDKPEAVMG